MTDPDCDKWSKKEKQISENWIKKMNGIILQHRLAEKVAIFFFTLSTLFKSLML